MTEWKFPIIPSLDFGTGDFSIGFWFNSTQIDGGDHRLIGDLNGGFGHIVYVNSGTLFFQIKGTSNTSSVSATGLMDGNWHHVVAQRNSNITQLYIDGNLLGSESLVTGNITNTETLRIGASSATTNEFDGKIDEVRIFNRALTESDINEAVHQWWWYTLLSGVQWFR